jgi:hypothetical protein
MKSLRWILVGIASIGVASQAMAQDKPAPEDPGRPQHEMSGKTPAELQHVQMMEGKNWSRIADGGYSTFQKSRRTSAG